MKDLLSYTLVLIGFAILSVIIKSSSWECFLIQNYFLSRSVIFCYFDILNLMLSPIRHCLTHSFRLSNASVLLAYEVHVLIKCSLVLNDFTHSYKQSLTIVLLVDSALMSKHVFKEIISQK